MGEKKKAPLYLCKEGRKMEQKHEFYFTFVHANVYICSFSCYIDDVIKNST